MRSLILAALYGATSSAQPAQSKIPVRELTPVAARTAQAIGQIGTVRELANGRVLVDDTRAKQLMVFDSTLRAFTVFADTASAVKYRGGSATLIPYLGDSTLMVEVEARTFLLITPEGTVGRAVALPNLRDIGSLVQFRTGTGTDALGRLVYRGVEGRGRGGPPPPAGFVARERLKTGNAQPLDSVPIVRGSFETRTADTVARIAVAAPTTIYTRDSTTGNSSSAELLNPVAPPIDDWIVTSSGEIAIVRAHDYHVDWISADGAPSTAPRMAYDLRRLTAQDKQRKIDSAQRIVDSVRAAGGYKTRLCSGNTGVCRTLDRNVKVASLEDIPDYLPPFRPGTVKADRDGNIWILPTTTAQSINGELVYDVVNRAQGLFQRVRIPKGKAVAGFGRDGVVYLLSGDAKNGFHLERTRVQLDVR